MTSSAIVVLFLFQTLTFIGTKQNVLTNIQIGNLYKNTHNNLDENNAELYKNVNNNVFDEIYEDGEDIRSNLDIERNSAIKHKANEEITKTLYMHTKSPRKYNVNEEISKNLAVHRKNIRKIRAALSFREFNEGEAKVRAKRDDDSKCEAFALSDGKIEHPHAKNGSTYYNNTDCVYVINDPAGRIIELTFVDVFSIEDHPDCAYDYLEIRDGPFGYSKLLGKKCGFDFPPQMTSTGPNVWLKFHSDDTIEHEGFHINVRVKELTGQSVPQTCYSTLKGRSGEIDSDKIDPLCKSTSQNLDVLWTIETPKHTEIFLNFTKYGLYAPNDCDENVVEVFGSILEASARLAKYCGSIATPISTKIDKNKNNHNAEKVKTNIMYVRIYASKAVKDKTLVKAKFTAYRPLAKNEKCDPEDEFDCDDNTCIDLRLICDSYADCRLKTDEDPERCKTVATSAISQTETMIILIILSLIISMIFAIIIFKCIRKLYRDHKMIKELQKQSLEQRLNLLVDSRINLDAQKMRESESRRGSLDRDNRANEMSKKKRDSFSKRKLTSIESDLNQESLIDLDDEPWRREAETQPIVPKDARRHRETPDRKTRSRRIETLKEEGSKESVHKKESKDTQEGDIKTADSRKDRKGKSKQTDTHGEESRSKRDRPSERQEIEHVPFGALDTKESGCQTRDSLFQNVPPSSSDGSGTTTSGATIARPSPPATSTSEITIEIPKPVPTQETKPQKRTDRRPISTETTRSAPDVIVVVKPM